MPWTNQEPEATDIILSGIRVEVKGEGLPIYAEIDKLPDGSYRATGGNLFNSDEIARDTDLEKVLRAVSKSYVRYIPN